MTTLHPGPSQISPTEMLTRIMDKLAKAIDDLGGIDDADCVKDDIYDLHTELCDYLHVKRSCTCLFCGRTMKKPEFDRHIEDCLGRKPVVPPTPAAPFLAVVA